MLRVARYGYSLKESALRSRSFVVDAYLKYTFVTRFVYILRVREPIHT